MNGWVLRYNFLRILGYISHSSFWLNYFAAFSFLILPYQSFQYGAPHCGVLNPFFNQHQWIRENSIPLPIPKSKNLLEIWPFNHKIHQYLVMLNLAIYHGNEFSLQEYVSDYQAYLSILDLYFTGALIVWLKLLTNYNYYMPIYILMPSVYGESWKREKRKEIVINMVVA